MSSDSPIWYCLRSTAADPSISDGSVIAGPFPEVEALLAADAEAARVQREAAEAEEAASREAAAAEREERERLARQRSEEKRTERALREKEKAEKRWAKISAMFRSIQPQEAGSPRCTSFKMHTALSSVFRHSHFLNEVVRAAFYSLLPYDVCAAHESPLRRQVPVR